METGVAYQRKIYAAQDVTTGYDYDVCVKCQYESVMPNDRVVNTHEVTHTLNVKQNAIIDCSSALTARTGWDTAFPTDDRLCIQ